MDRRNFAALAVGVGLVVGAVGTLLFYGKTVGVSFPIFILLGIAAVLGVAVATRRRLRPRNLWPLIPLLFFAMMVAVRADPLVLTLNVLAALALGALTLYYLPLERPLDEDSFAEHTINTIGTGVVVLPYGLGEVGESWAWARERLNNRGRQATLVLRGVMFALPVVIVFGVLLGSADAVFASYARQAWDGFRKLVGLQYVGDTVGQAVFTLFLATVAAGGISFGLKRREQAAQSSPVEVEEPAAADAPEGDTETDTPAEKRKPGFKLTMIETGIVLGSIVALFTAFVLIQFRYFFGGQANVTVEGLTYAQYARRGFFELVAVSGLTLGLALWLDLVTVRQEGRETRLFRGLAVALVALTGVMLVSASQRMLLYEDAFGFTQLRVYTHVAMLWLGVLFGVFLLAVFRVRKNIFSLGWLVVIIGYLVTLNLLNVDAYIAERNIARYHAGKELDIAFLNSLSVDAAPAILALYNGLESSSQLHEWAGQWLARQLAVMGWERDGAGGTVFSANVARSTAWAQLAAVRASLPVYDSSLDWRWRSGPARQAGCSRWDALGTCLSR
jgi:hypothetical protein